ncbi:uncharacterized protein LOC112522725 [Cynara cardunculus var. scolymus]|uniref:Uncharacterized protein n=1 Tax=Cynara cardunculus var. scolymus TaxID=59895 RepID=A0A103XVT4_CYNCS|nr:uncharacterized protein LOC112522725 [Cynara cardunculus var. scolymus]KVH97818.1 Protein of unknown function DUF1645 [Cynara cardunculus var. scolymus]
MEVHKSIDLSSSSGYDPDPKDYIEQSAADEVNFGFNHLKIDENDSHKQQLTPESPETDDEEDEEEEEEEGDFTFMCIGDNDSQTNEVFESGQIRPVFPLFDQSLLLGGDNDGEGRWRLPIHVPVDKVFIESPRRSPSSMASGDQQTDEVSAGTFCALPKESDTGTPEINMKSNSTGFSKLWRFRDKMNRSNSDGRDAFVFLETPERTRTTPSTSIGKSNAGDDLPAKVNGAGGVGKAKVVKKGSKAQNSKASAHEVYLKQRGGQTEDERRRSYLPYRPGLMGFFTNVNGGLSKNVHPF